MPYRPRIAGTSSKLRAFRDGLRILKMIVALSLRLSPWRPMFVEAIALAVLAGAIGSDPLWIAAIILFLAGIAAAAVTGVRRELIGRAP